MIIITGIFPFHCVVLGGVFELLQLADAVYRKSERECSCDVEQQCKHTQCSEFRTSVQCFRVRAETPARGIVSGERIDHWK